MDDFLRFVVERHRIWEQRQAGAPGPWTADPILASRKFTNVFRILDPGTQFIMTDLWDPSLSDRDQLMRLFLYRHTGRIETWEYLDLMLGGYPTVDTLEDVRAAWKEYRGASTVTVRGKEARNAAGGTKVVFQRSLFTGAYLVFPQSDVPGTDKLDSIINLAQRLFTEGSPDDVMPDWRRLGLRKQRERFAVLRRNKGVGDFMAMQVLTDWGYLQEVDLEDEFLIPGPGSIKGAKALFPNRSVSDTVKEVLYRVRGVAGSPRLGYRQPSLMDIGSNLLCEWSKYVRYRAQGTQPKPYVPAHPGPQAPPTLPAYYTAGADLL